MMYHLRERAAGRTFRCYFLKVYDCWQCECNYLCVVGIPCSHLIAVLTDPEINGQLIYYINSRWIHEKQDAITEHAKPFITNKKRRP